MDTKKKDQIIIRLISNDLIHSRLLLGLHKLDIDASKYQLYLSDVIFRMMGFREKELEPDLFEEYSLLTMNAISTHFELNDPEKIRELAKGIYVSLRDWQPISAPKQETGQKQHL